jgi:hypothetical protein
VSAFKTHPVLVPVIPPPRGSKNKACTYCCIPRNSIGANTKTRAMIETEVCR